MFRWKGKHSCYCHTDKITITLLFIMLQLAFTGFSCLQPCALHGDKNFSHNLKCFTLCLKYLTVPNDSKAYGGLVFACLSGC